jgi:hypothetical protein
MPKKTPVTTISIVIFLLLIAAVAFSSGSLAAGLPFQADMPKAAFGTLTALIAIALFVERGMAVVNAMLFGDEQRDVNIGIDDGSKDAADLARVYGSKERVRLLGSFIAGLFVSAAGVRTLESLLNLKDQPTNPLFIPVDVVLTALLIAGGGNGLAYLLQIAKWRLAQESTTPPAAQPPAPVKKGLRAPAAAAAPKPVSPALRARLITSG